MPDAPHPDDAHPHDARPEGARPDGVGPEGARDEDALPEGTRAEDARDSNGRDDDSSAHDVRADDTPAATGASGTTTGEGTAPLTEDELARIATPAAVRRAPRYPAFLVAGALVGIVVGLVLALVTAGDSPVGGDDGGVLPFLAGQNGVRWVMAVGCGVLGAFVGGLLAVLADRRSVRRRRPPV